MVFFETYCSVTLNFFPPNIPRLGIWYVIFMQLSLFASPYPSCLEFVLGFSCHIWFLTFFVLIEQQRIKKRNDIQTFANLFVKKKLGLVRMYSMIVRYLYILKLKVTFIITIGNLRKWKMEMVNASWFNLLVVRVMRLCSWAIQEVFAEVASL